jgi:hypothetical protein
MRLRYIDAGLYETRDGRYGVVRVESMGEWDDVSQGGWSLVRGGAKDGVEFGEEYRTLADAREALEKLLAEEGR